MAEVDVLVVGANTAGIFFAAQMAKENFKVLVIDKAKEEAPSKSFDVVHLEEEVFSTFALEPPKEGDEDFITVFNQNQSRSALDRYPKKSTTSVYVLHFKPYLTRLRNWAKSLGVVFQFETAFVGPLYNNQNKVNGALVRENGEEKTVYARLMADASGIVSVVRRSLPDDYGIEKFEIGPKDKFYVVLYYAQLQNREQAIENRGWPYYKTWLAPQHQPGGVILGIGANFSFDYAKKQFAYFENHVSLPPYTFQYIEQGATPWRRPPYSFVGDGFVVLGDAACLTRPWNGEGIRCGFGHGLVAAKECAQAMKEGAYPTREKLWGINLKYQKEEGAQYATLRAILPSLVHTAPKENDWLFENSIMFKDEDDPQDDPFVAKLIGGVLKGKLKPATLFAILKAGNLGKQLEKHYQNYPAAPGEDYTKWCKKAETLWAKAPSMARETTNSQP